MQTPVARRSFVFDRFARRQRRDDVTQTESAGNALIVYIAYVIFLGNYLGTANSLQLILLGNDGFSESVDKTVTRGRCVVLTEVFATG